MSLKFTNPKMASIRQGGFSLVEMVIAIGVLSIFSLGAISLQMRHSKGAIAITQKLAQIDLEQLLIKNLAKPSSCNALILGLQFGPNANLPKKVPINNRTEITFNGDPANYIVKLNEKASPLSQNLIAESFNLSILSVSNKTYQAEVQINFKQNILERPLKPISIPITFISNDASTVSKCGVDIDTEEFSGEKNLIGYWRGTYDGRNQKTYPIQVLAVRGKAETAPANFSNYLTMFGSHTPCHHQSVLNLPNSYAARYNNNPSTALGHKINRCDIIGETGTLQVEMRNDDGALAKDCSLSFWVPVNQTYRVMSRVGPLSQNDQGCVEIYEIH